MICALNVPLPQHGSQIQMQILLFMCEGLKVIIDS